MLKLHIREDYVNEQSNVTESLTEDYKDSDAYKKLADYAKSIGLRWGGDFKNFTCERWHFDMGV